MPRLFFVGGMQVAEDLIIRGPDGRFLPGTKSPTPITKENSHALHRMRREKMRSRLRARIREITLTREGVPLNSSAEAIAEGAAMLWEEVVLNPEAYPRDRLDAFWRIGQLLELIPSGAERLDPGAENQDTRALASLAREQILLMVHQLEESRA